jgi:hypothetical protein
VARSWPRRRPAPGYRFADRELILEAVKRYRVREERLS